MVPMGEHITAGQQRQTALVATGTMHGLQLQNVFVHTVSNQHRGAP